jgi:murein DD-endopeptidase MepM/ murein hydrolase activator NlpD
MLQKDAVTSWQDLSNKHSPEGDRLRKTRFTRMMIQANNLNPANFESWLFCQGMLFGSPDKWWGDHGLRGFPHEGIDFCLYSDPSGQIRRLNEQTRIPVMHDGLVRAMFTDYLGQAIVIEHEYGHHQNGKFLTVYAHTNPQDGIRPGVAVNEGDIIATIADTKHSKAKILPHLHLSFGLPSPALRYDPFVWDIMRDAGRITLLDPFDAIDWHCRKLDSDNSGCFEL